MLGLASIAGLPIASIGVAHSVLAGTGVSTVAFTTSGSVVGLGALLGVSSVTFTNVGLLTANGALTSAVGVNQLFGPIASMPIADQSSGIFATVFKFSVSGVLTGTGAVSGAATLTFTLAASATALPGHIWQNADGLVLVFGPKEGKTYPASISPPNIDPAPGKQFYDRPNLLKSRRLA